MGERVLITGGGGFIGSAVAARLVAAGCEVTAADIQFEPDRLGELGLGRDVVRRVALDVRDEAAVREAVSGHDRVLHLAAIADVAAYHHRTLDVLDTNLLGSRHALRAAHDAGVPIVIASTSEVLGKNPALLDEDADTHLGATTRPRWSYATSKIASEHYAWALHRQGLTVAAVRYFNAYGPTLDAPGKGRVIAKFLGAVSSGEPLRLVDGGHAVRCFCFIDDAARATAEVLLALRPGHALDGRPWHIGNPEPVTMRDLAEHVLRLTGHDRGTEDVPGPAFFGAGFEDIPRRVPDCDGLAGAIGFRAEISLEDGLRRTLAHWGLLRADAPPPPAPAPLRAVRPVYAPTSALLADIAHSLHTGWTTNHGPHTRALEASASARLDGARILAVRSGATALELGLEALLGTGRLAPGAAVILPSWTYIASLNAVERAGLRPVLADASPDTWTLAPAAVRAALDAHPDAGLVLATTVYGVPPDLDALVQVAAARGVHLALDDAQGLGSRWRGRAIHPDVALTTWSLHATKVVPGLEGGLVHSPYDDVADRIAALRTHGLTPDPHDAVAGTNGKIDEISARLALDGLSRLDDVIARRRAAATTLRAAAVAGGFHVQHWPDEAVVNAQNLGLRASQAAGGPGAAVRALDALAAHGVEGRRYFFPALHRLRRLAPQDVGRLPVTEALAEEVFIAPLHSSMSEAEVARVADALAAGLP